MLRSPFFLLSAKKRKMTTLEIWKILPGSEIERIVAELCPSAHSEGNKGAQMHTRKLVMG